MQKKTYSVYMHVFPNGKQYIGITCNNPQKRWGGGSGYRKQPKIYAAIQKYGWENIQHIILLRGLTKEEAEEQEIKLIKEFNTIKHGYNVENGGNTIGTHSEETKKKISDSNRGKKASPETIARISKAKKGKQCGVKNPFYGKHHTIETRQEHSNFMKGNAYFKGHHHSDEYKKMKSEQMKEKYSEGRNPRSKKVLMTTEEGAETVFYSLRNAAENAKVSPSTMHKLVNKGIQQNGCRWEYINE